MTLRARHGVFVFPLANLLSLLVGLGLPAGIPGLAALPPQIPRGVFSLSPAGNTFRDAVATNPSVDGITIRQDWSELEPTEGTYNWSFLDSEVARAEAAGKPVLLRINTQAHKPTWVTNAVAQAGGTFFTFDKDGAATTIPVFWDPTFLAKKKAMIAALGAHFTGKTTIKVVWTSFANASSEDWSVPHTSTDITNWFNAGYTSAKMLDAGAQIIGATMTAFPNQFVTIAVGGSGNLDSDASYVARNAVAAAKAKWPGRLIVQKNDLATFNPPAPGTGTLFQPLWDNRPDVAGQMLDSCYGDSTYRNNGGVPDDAGHILRKSVDLGVGYGMKYIEIYQNDVLNLPVDIGYAHNALLNPIGAPRPPSGLRRVP